jgi:uncharacterized protein YbjT (DUF2867 family)
MQDLTGVTLVVGATGNHGATGNIIAHKLLASGSRVRALVRSTDERAEQLRESGMDLVVGDLHNRPTLLSALEGADSVYFTYPVTSGRVDAAANPASAIRELGTRPHVVVLSLASADANSVSSVAREHWVSEEVLLWAGIDMTALRIAAFFHENLLTLHGASVREHGVIANNYGAGATPLINGRDVAEIGYSPSPTRKSAPAGRYCTPGQPSCSRSLKSPS